MRTLKALYILLSVVLISSCTTMDKGVESDETLPPTQTTTRQRKPVPPVDLEKLSKSMGMYKDVTDVGFSEKPFNDCDLPVPHRVRPNDCSTQYLTAIQFRMRCRDSEGTVESVSQYELEPLTASGIRWNIEGQGGTTSTNSSGFGRVLIRSPRSLRKKQFRLTHNGQIMGVSAAEVRQFVLPKYWCR